MIKTGKIFNVTSIRVSLQRDVVKSFCNLACFYFQAPLKPPETDSFALFVENNVKHRSCRDLFHFLDHVSLSFVSLCTRYNQAYQHACTSFP